VTARAPAHFARSVRPFASHPVTVAAAQPGDASDQQRAAEEAASVEVTLARVRRQAELELATGLHPH